MEYELTEKLRLIAALIDEIGVETNSYTFENFIESRKDKINLAGKLQELAMEIDSLPAEFVSDNFQFSKMAYELQSNRLVLSDYGLNDVMVWKIISRDIKLLAESVKKILGRK